VIELSYSFASSWNERAAGFSWSSADETTLRFKAFLGDQIFIANGVDFSARWGWVPLMDFAACLVRIINRLETGEPELVFEFTESDAQLQFNRQGNNVLITSNYCNGKAAVELGELRAAAILHADRVLNEAINSHPALKANSSLMSWYPAVTKY
jgi:hypothetical protein